MALIQKVVILSMEENKAYCISGGTTGPGDLPGGMVFELRAIGTDSEGSDPEYRRK